MNEGTQDITEYNDEDLGVDISLPDIPIPTAQDEEKKIVKDDVEVAFKFSFVGAGQGGCRIAETFSRLGYRKIAAINTAVQDLNTVKLDNKLCIGGGGAGKDPQKATKIYEKKEEDVLDFLRYSFGDEFDRTFVCVGAGGGTGAGTMVPLVHTSIELQKSLGIDPEVGLIIALPKSSEGKKVNANAYKALEKAYDLVEDGLVSPLIIVDNERISKLYPGLVVSNFWQTANSSMAGLFHLFNLTAARDSTYTAFDSKDYMSVLNSGLIVFGAAPVKDWKDPVSISRAVRDNLKGNILSGGIDLSSGDCAGVIIVGGKEALDNTPQRNLDQAYDQLSRILKKNSTVHRGIYSGDKAGLTVYSTIGGLSRPVDKLKELKKLGDLA
jgi:cell division GTPase FtsZ